MHFKETSAHLLPDEFDLVKKVADERQVSTDEAATQLVHEAMSQRFRKSTGRIPARIYTLPKP